MNSTPQDGAAPAPTPLDLTALDYINRALAYFDPGCSEAGSHGKCQAYLHEDHSPQVFHELAWAKSLLAAPLESPRPTTAPGEAIRLLKEFRDCAGGTTSQSTGEAEDWVDEDKFFEVYNETGQYLDDLQDAEIEAKEAQEESRGEPGEPSKGPKSPPICPKCQDLADRQVCGMCAECWQKAQRGAPEEAPSPAPRDQIIDAEKRGFIWGHSESDNKALDQEDAVSRAEEKWEALYAKDPDGRWTKSKPMEVQPRDPMDDNESLDPRYGKPHALHILRCPCLEIDGLSYRVESAVWEKVGQQHHSLMENHRIIRTIRASLRALCEGLQIENLEAALSSTPENLKWLGQQIRERAEAGVQAPDPRKCWVQWDVKMKVIRSTSELEICPSHSRQDCEWVRMVEAVPNKEKNHG